MNLFSAQEEGMEISTKYTAAYVEEDFRASRGVGIQRPRTDKPFGNPTQHVISLFVRERLTQRRSKIKE